MPEAAQPAKRGRPRKQPSTSVVEEAGESVSDAWVADSDPRVGQSCDPAWSSVGYSDGRTYLCKNGVIVERVY